MMKSIKAKIALCMTLLILLSGIFGWVCVYFYFSNTLVKNEIERHEEIVNTHINQISAELASVQQYARTICYGREVQLNLQDCVENQGYGRQMALRELDEKMRNYVILRPGNLSNIYIASRELDSAYSFAGSYDYDLQQDWLTPFRSTGGGSSFFSPIRTQELFSPHVYNKVVSFVQPISSLQGANELLGYIVINMDATQLFSNAYQENATIEGYYLTDEADQVLLDHRPGPASSQPEAAAVKNGILQTDRSYLIQKPVPGLDMNLNVIIAKSELQKLVSGAQNILLVIILLSLISAVILAVVLGHSLTRPILRLTNNMKQAADGNLETVALVSGKDEIADMSRIFNFMLRKIRLLIQQNTEAGKAQKELTMKLFLSKINPHFIYNTLNCIIYLARKEKKEEIIRLTTSFIHILRKNMEMGNRNVTIEEEMVYLRHYIEILKYRYNHTISLDFLIPAKFYGVKLLPMVLYPLVENSVFHGISAKDENGLMVISVTEEGDSLKFSVEDDGVGITPARLEEIRRYLEDGQIQETSGNIGLRNVNDRIKLYYGEESALQIDSSVGSGTRIQFLIKKDHLEKV